MTESESDSSFAERKDHPDIREFEPAERLAMLIVDKIPKDSWPKLSDETVEWIEIHTFHKMNEITFNKNCF